MKTNVTMIRTMGQFNILQRTKDGYFDANDLVTQWNKSKGNVRKNMSDFLNSKNTKEFIEVLESELAQTEISAMAYSNQKGRNTSRGRTKDQVWMHPYLFIDFAMWINPTFKYSVIKFVYDELIKERRLAGDNYIQLSASGVKLAGYNFVEVAKAMQWIVYGKCEKNLRQTASHAQLKELSDLQNKLSFAIDMGYITTYKQLMNELRKVWNNKNRKF